MEATQEFSLSNARECLAASAAAYSDEPTIQSAQAHVLIREFNRQPIAGLGAEAGSSINREPLTGFDLKGAEQALQANTVIIAFRGTANLRDFVTDAECWMKAAGHEGVEVHRGFLGAFTSVVDPILENLKQHERTPIVYVTGHSLGGALAMLCAKVLHEEGHYIAQVYTFGQPRVGNKVYAEKYDSKLKERTWRVVHEEDIVPRVPGLLAGFRHAGQEAFLPSTGGLKINPSIWEKLISDVIGIYQAWKVRGKMGALDLLDDHKVKNYMARLGVSRGEQSEVNLQAAGRQQQPKESVSPTKTDI